MNPEIVADIRKRLNKMAAEGTFDNKCVAVFGANHPGDEIICHLAGKGIHTEAVLDNNPINTGNTLMGVTIYTPKEFAGNYRENLVVLIASRYYNEMKQQLEEYGYRENVHIFRLIETKARKSHEEQLECLAADYEVYQRICKPSCRYALCPVKANGDVYMSMRYMAEGVIPVVIGGACRKVAGLFSSQAEVVSQGEAESLMRIAVFLGKDSNIIISQPYSSYVEIFNNMECYKGLNFDDFYQTIWNESRSAMPQFKHEAADSVLGRLEKGKSVILSPYANSLPRINPVFYEALTKCLVEEGYKVFTNSSGEDEPVIKGSEPIFFGFDEMKKVLEYAGCFIAMRSGMCELASTADCKKVILYPIKAARHGTLTGLYGLKNMGLCEDALELETNGDEKDSIDSILEYIRRK